MGAVTKEERDEEPAPTRSTEGHMARQVSRAEEDLARSNWSAVCHSRRFRRETPSRQRVRTMASAEIAGLVRKEDERQPQLPGAGHRITATAP